MEKKKSPLQDLVTLAVHAAVYKRYNIHECFNNPFQTLCNIYDQSQKQCRYVNYVDRKCNGNG